MIKQFPSVLTDSADKGSNSVNNSMPAKERKNLTHTVPAFRVPTWVYEIIEEVSARDRRDKNQVAALLLERGALAFKRDGKLVEPEADPDVDRKRKTG